MYLCVLTCFVVFPSSCEGNVVIRNSWVRGSGEGNIYIGFTVYSSGLHWVISVEIYVILPEGFMLRSFPSSR